MQNQQTKEAVDNAIKTLTENKDKITTLQVVFETEDNGFFNGCAGDSFINLVGLIQLTLEEMKTKYIQHKIMAESQKAIISARSKIIQ